jgi:outer membrane receptor protein involved in Fe transport
MTGWFLFSVNVRAQSDAPVRMNPKEALQQRVTATTGVVSGMVLDDDEQPLEYATVAILKLSDSSVVSGGISNQSGRVIIDGVAFGTYLLKISYIGFKPVFVSPVTLSQEKPIYVFGKQQFAANSRQLQGVTVTAEKEMIQNNLDKRVFNVERSVVTAGATGEDVLNNIPSVNVDLDGNVSLRGSESVTILINGRPSHLTMSEIPADMIASVEVVTNPSAKYDPDGVSGIINVILKKDKKLGFNAGLSAGMGVSNYKNRFYTGSYNASANLNFMYKKVNFFVSYSLRSFSSHSFSNLTRTNVFGQDSTFLRQNSTGEGGGMPQNVRAGLDYFINDQHTLSFDMAYRRRAFGNESDITSLTTRSSMDTVSLYDQHSSMPARATDSWNAGLNYGYTSQKIKGQTLNVDFSFSHSGRENENNMEQIYVFPIRRHFYQQAVTSAISYRGTAQIDFVTPIGNGGRLETGYKFNMQWDEDDYRYFTGEQENALTQDHNRDNASKYSQYIHAVYLIYSNSVKKKFKYQLGLRSELANVLSELDSEQEPFAPKPYFNIFPTVHLRYDFNDIHSLQFGYSMRVGRPRGFQLNPYVIDADKLNLMQGNRKLRPEYTQSFDLGYLFIKNKSSVMTSLFYRYRYDIISRYTVLINDSTTLTSYHNLNSSHSYGMEVSYQQDIFKFWKLSLTGSLYQMFIHADSLYDRNLSNNITGQVRLNNNFDLKHDIQIQLTADFRAPTLTLNNMNWEGGGMLVSSSGQGRISAMWGMDFGLKKSFFKKTFSIALRVSDIFGTRHALVTSYGKTAASDYYSQTHRYRDSRQFWITATYQIANYKVKRKMRQIDEGDEY